MYMTDQNSHYTYLNIITKCDEEILKNHLRNLQPKWTNHVAKKISLSVDKDCLLKINGDELLIKPEYGLVIEYNDKDISSIITLTENVSLYAIIGY